MFKERDKVRSGSPLQFVSATANVSAEDGAILLLPSRNVSHSLVARGHRIIAVVFDQRDMGLAKRRFSAGPDGAQPQRLASSLKSNV
jgi:hypothetical protein